MLMLGCRIYIILFVLPFLLGCSSSENEPLIGILMDSYIHERWQKDQEYLESELNDLGAEVIIMKADGDDKLQFNQAIELIDKGVDVLIVVAADQNSAGSIVDLAHMNNVPVIAYDRLIKKCDLDYYVSFDHVTIGRKQAEFLTKNIEDPKLCIIGGSIHDNNAFMLYAGQNAVLEPLQANGKVRIFANVFTEQWRESEAYSLALNIFKKHPEINGVLAANDAIAAGVLTAAMEAGAGPIKVTGMDADSSALVRIASGLQSMTMYKPIKKLAYSAANLAYALGTNDTISIGRMKFASVSNGKKEVESTLLTSLIVDQSNVSLMLEK